MFIQNYTGIVNKYKQKAVNESCDFNETLAEQRIIVIFVYQCGYMSFITN